jgi:hypothetical protein
VEERMGIQLWDKKISEEKLRKLEALAAWTDAALYDLRIGAGNLSPKELGQGIIQNHFYFVGLTLDALEDRELAEQLAPAFEKIESEQVEYTDTLGVFSGILRLKHGMAGKIPWRRCSSMVLVALGSKKLAERLIPAL